MKNFFEFLAALSVIVLALSCAAQKKLAKVQAGVYSPALNLPDELQSRLRNPENNRPQQADTIVVEDRDGTETFIMSAVKDEGGDMVATDVISAAVVTARFRNVAERHGKISIEFQIMVPKEMQDTRWQLRFDPSLCLLGDTIRLERVIITGEEYRRSQIRGYQHYEKFLSRIISDSTRFIDLNNLEIFLQRNIPALYAMKTDTTFVSDERFASVFGVTEKEAVEHYTDRHAIRMNDRLKSRRAKMYAKYVKSPIVTQGVRIDTVLHDYNGDFSYTYVQTFTTRPKLRKAEILLSGEIFEQDMKLYTIPCTEPLTFYISSVASFVDASERYLTKVLERRAEANTACYIDFAVGKSDINPDFGGNASEIARIRGNLLELLKNKTYDLDSIVISAFASPEGSVSANNALSLQRARSASSYFGSYLRHQRDSIRNAAGMKISFNDDMTQSEMTSAAEISDIRFVSGNGGENWTMLDALVSEDTLLTSAQRKRYENLSAVSDLDERERKLKECDFYNHLRRDLYPALRIVKFDFHLHRKGMIKDTVHTTEPDTTYMNGVKALRDHDYKLAVELLRPYNDYNAAVAYCALDYNQSALSILEKLPRTARVEYMLALVYSRQNKNQKAVQAYLNACEMEHGYIHRGNLDPEISSLIKRYGLSDRLSKKLED